jgi:hypothetical protein
MMGIIKMMNVRKMITITMIMYEDHENLKIMRIMETMRIMNIERKKAIKIENDTIADAKNQYLVDHSTS